MSKIASLTRISVVNASYYAYHGVNAEEKELGGQYQVDVDVAYDATSAVMSDDVKSAVNYEEILFCVNEVMSEESVNLIETLAYEILTTIMDKFTIIDEATVRVRKINAPVRTIVDAIECEQTMHRVAAQA
ncbi:MAG: dihydroneopterin aldolase [Candidatus Kapaibacterium sp.]